jgi:hypothetical protein
VGVLGDVRILENRPEPVNGNWERDVGDGRLDPVVDGDIVALALLGGEGNADQPGFHWVGAGGFDVDYDGVSLAQFGHHRLQRFYGVHDPVVGCPFGPGRRLWLRKQGELGGRGWPSGARQAV